MYARVSILKWSETGQSKFPDISQVTMLAPTPTMTYCPFSICLRPVIRSLVPTPSRAPARKTVWCQRRYDKLTRAYALT